jgi:hypothetical protein
LKIILPFFYKDVAPDGAGIPSSVLLRIAARHPEAVLEAAA